ncbi:Ca2+/H+ antiporter [Scheffersomyces coipomensis]|uniref:Ca2+/H+ antiporter n=1 Tax=Scheffersomyces coipomensis TaxID=1788519 RepID=UPI00315D22F7
MSDPPNGVPNTLYKQSPRLLPLHPENSNEFSRNSSVTNIHTPNVRNKSVSKQRKKSKPHLKRLGSITGSHQTLVYSVDDDVNENVDEENVEDNTEIVSDRDYLEGYSDALRALHQRRSKLITATLSNDELNKTAAKQIESTIAKDLIDAEENIKLLDNLRDSDNIADNTIEYEEVAGEDESNGIGGGGDNDSRYEDDEDNDDDDNGSVRSSQSSQTIESLNLRDRQAAINKTHPFGIKIWKPSLYKKQRSVATRAEEDIHDFDPRKPKRIFWGVTLTNILWSLVIGIPLYIICLMGATVVFISSGLGIHRPSRPYVRLLLKLGRYWFHPFGKFVLLNRDENYLSEDESYGRTLKEFQRWRLQEEGRLFFAPPRRNTASAETRPLLKDHRGRPLGDAYSSLGGDDQTYFQQQQQQSQGIPESALEHDDQDDQDDQEEYPDIKVRFFGRGSWSSGRFVFYLFFYGILQPILYLVGGLCWLIVFTIPMTNITSTICDHLRRHPLALDFEIEKEYYKRHPKKKRPQSIILCTYRCCGFHYYKYTIDGTNIFFINLLAAVAFVICDFYIFKENFKWEVWFTDSTFIFCFCFFSIIPLAYFLGQAVASISAQSSMGVGAVINAFFTTIVEIFLYCVALNQGKGKLVEGSMIGSILGGVLLLPGLSMCSGALVRKTQKYNPQSAGVSSTMFLFAMVVMFAPSLFYQIYGPYEIKCRACDFTNVEDDCTKCRFVQPGFSLDILYHKIIQPFSVIVASSLFATYICGLYFTLRTHASLIWATHEPTPTRKDEHSFRSPSVSSFATPLQLPAGSSKITQRLSTLPPSALKPLQSPSLDKHKKSIDESFKPIEPVAHDEGGGGHDAPNWSTKKSTIILLGATVLYAIIAEILVDTVDAVLVNYPIDPKFLGLTVFALVPNTTEFLNAISFAVSGNVALSMEIGSAYALQVVLIQIPCLVFYSIYMGFVNVDQIFSLVFPRWDIIATLISIYLFTYIYAEGRSNYFKGFILILMYAVVMIGFWFNDKIEYLNDGYTGGRDAYF